MRSNREYDYFGNVLEYKYDYFPSCTSTSTQKVLVLEYEYKYTSTITPSLHGCNHSVSWYIKVTYVEFYQAMFVRTWIADWLSFTSQPK